MPKGNKVLSIDKKVLQAPVPESPSVIAWFARAARAILVIATIYVSYQLLLTRILGGQTVLVSVIIFWLLTAYVVLPRIHRFLTKIYIPDYFIGRTRTSEGLLSDPINITVIGSQAQLVQAMSRAGWVEAEPLSAKSGWKMALFTVLRKSYPGAPVSSLYLFSRRQDLAFQQQVAGNPQLRHHVRFWRTPRGWKLPGGFQSDWLGAATYDNNIGLSFFTLQFTHRIGEHIDEERDYVTKSIVDHNPASVRIIKDYAVAYHTRNGGGDNIRTDGALPFIDVSKI